MRTTILLVITVIVSLNAWGQKNEYNHQIGFDAGSFITKFISFSQSTSSTSPYAFLYRKLGDKSNFRLGAGLSFSVLDSDEQGSNASSAVYFKVGSEKYIDFGQSLKNTPGKERWRFFYGIDGVTSFLFSGNSDNDNEYYNFGIGPSVLSGFLFNINERLSLSTELSYDIQAVWNKTSSNSRFNLRGQFAPPTSIFVHFEF